MKKILLLVAAIMVIGPATTLFADHAKLMPENVGRVYLAPIYTSTSNVFNDDGDRKGTTLGMEMWNVGFAWEHGVLSWMTAAIQWTPGYTVHSKVASLGEATNVNDMGDVFVGAKIQVVGSTALVASDDMRIGIAPGLKVPLTKVDFKKEAEKFAGGNNDFTANRVDKHVLAAGGRLYFDYLFTKEFFVNFYNETIIYVQKGKLKNHDLIAGGAVLFGAADSDVDYKYQLTFEIEPNYTLEFAPKTTIEFGLPISYVVNPAPDFNYSVADKAIIDVVGGVAGMSLSGTKKSEVVTVKPTVGLFFMYWPLPIEFKFAYFMPVWGKNANASNTMSAQVRVYYKI